MKSKKAASSIERQLTWLRRIAVITFLGAQLFSYPLWLGTSGFPSAPVLWHAPKWVEGAIFLVALIGCLGALGKKRTFLFASVAAMATLAGLLLDEVRLQPWVVQLVPLILIFSLRLPGNVGQAAKNTWKGPCLEGEHTLLLGQLVQISIYFWAGFHKFNEGFRSENISYFINSIFADFPRFLPPSEPLHMLGWFPPLIEIGLALAFSIPATRKIALVISLLFHSGILLAIGPFGHNTDQNIWPWNIGMVVLNLYLFRPDQPSVFRLFLDGMKTSAAWGRGLTLAVIVFFLGLPSLHLFNLWDCNLSVGLYTGNIDGPLYFIHPRVVDRIPSHARGFVGGPFPVDRLAPEMAALIPAGLGYRHFDLESWAMKAFFATVPPEERVYSKLLREFCRESGLNRDDLVVLYRKKVGFFERNWVKFTRSDCEGNASSAAVPLAVRWGPLLVDKTNKIRRNLRIGGKTHGIALELHLLQGETFRFSHRLAGASKSQENLLKWNLHSHVDGDKYYYQTVGNINGELFSAAKEGLHYLNWEWPPEEPAFDLEVEIEVTRPTVFRRWLGNL